MIIKNVYEEPEINVLCALPVEGILSTSGFSPDFTEDGEEIDLTY